MLDLRSRLGLTTLVPRTKLLCSRCNNRVVSHIGFFRKRGVCAACLITEAAVATIQAKNLAIIGIGLTLAGIVIGMQRSPDPPSPVPAPTPPKATPVTTAQPLLPVPSGVARRETQQTTPPQSISVSVPAPARKTIPSKPATDVASPAVEPLRIEQEEATEASSTASAPEREPEVTVTPLVIEVITVTAPTRRAVRLHEPVLPRVPPAFRAQMSRQCVLIHVAIAPSGEATATVRDDGGVQDFFVQAALRDAVRGWKPAETASGGKIEDSCELRYCWK